MSDQPPTAPAGYATGQPARVLAAAVSAGTEADRERALRKLRRWEDVGGGMADGTLTIGSRTPVADTPAWVTLEVAPVARPSDSTVRVISVGDAVASPRPVRVEWIPRGRETGRSVPRLRTRRSWK
ncbi:hypothetical protein ACIGNX_27300 [Actinosynnema sp. NPDC053489]|uniref:hypothetical protein n=1 Tax=Actinosynnema sp. NPDC053489 TaxID=3363916 RepID=UPI0037C9FB94